MTLYKMVKPTEGTVLQYVGVYVRCWQPEWGEPTVGFIQDDSNIDLQAENERLHSTIAEMKRELHHIHSQYRAEVLRLGVELAQLTREHP
jgi:hypothetical protein